MAQAAQSCCWACWRHQEGCQRQSGGPAWMGKEWLPPWIVIRIMGNSRFCLLTWHSDVYYKIFCLNILACKFYLGFLVIWIASVCQQTRASEWGGWSSSSPSGTSLGPWWCQPGKQWSRCWRVMGRVRPSGRRRRRWSRLAMTWSCRLECCHCKIKYHYTIIIIKVLTRAMTKWCTVQGCD